MLIKFSNARSVIIQSKDWNDFNVRISTLNNKEKGNAFTATSIFLLFFVICIFAT